MTQQRAWRITSGQPDPAAVERLLRQLPGWFGIESSVLDYIEAARHMPAYLAWPAGRAASGEPGRQPAGPADPADGERDGQPAGVLLAARHFPGAAEIYLMAVAPDQHRRGAGRALVAALEADLIADGTRFLQVKTLGPARPDPGYALTRKFYAAAGFQPLEEIHGLWLGNPCLIMIKTL
ncbi:MAG TPA: GNAT family N-acetyltransferase [Streptosporangiaceae bacterium]|nr:GNAT family N-acetyltransferase [Streptosporangiaceae bacterium]